MKKITLTILFGLFLTLSFGQTIVSTTPANKNGLLEEFTGIHCGYCPQGHAIANSIKADNPDTFYIINVHTGGYAAPGNGEPDFRTEFGNAIASQSQLAGYPAGTISRHYFGHSQSGSPSGATALGRGQWESDFNSLKTQPSYVNVAVEADVDNRSRMLTVHVEAYYTGDSPVNTNLLNVALLQNNTAGPQSGGNAGNNYNHMHRLINMVTGQWGEEISTTTNGTFVDKTFTVYVSVDHRGVPIILDDLEVVAFIAETHQEVITASGAQVNKINTTLNQNDVILSKINKIKENCSGVASPTIKVENIGSNPVSSLDIEYSLNGESTQSFTWSGNMASLTSKMITIPATVFSLQENNTFSSTITTTDDNMSNNDYAEDVNFQMAPESTEDITVQILTDNWGYELTWNIKNSSGTIVANGGGDGTNGSTGSYPNNGNTTENYNLPMDCYILEVNDAYGDGGNAVRIKNSNGIIVTYIQGGYGAGDYTSFSTSDTASILDSEFADVVIYPNPSNGMVSITEAKGDSISIFNVLGKQVYNATILTNNNSINLSNLASGVYLVKLIDGDKEETRKLIIK